MEKYQVIADKIEGVFQDGFTLSGKILHYIDSTFSDPSAEGINAILSGNGSEKESLLRLIFSPDESIQSLLEEFLEETDIRKEDVNRVTGYLSARKIQSKIFFPDERGTINAQVPPEILGEFIDHLNMPAKLNDKLDEALKYVSCDRSRTLAKVKIRNRRKEFTEKGIYFLCLFFEKMGSEEASIDECLESAIGILEDSDDRSDIYRMLSDKKAAYFQSLINSERFEEELRKNNIETLLLQGVRPVSIDKDTAVRKMKIIDRICLAVFGKTAYYEKNIVVS
ncbi:MAG: hypothetical protein EHM85_17140 [Desulfobacteraceae bacterium]|nr:MAG: hypothetical protein EHM85_17140 [Desulfobacteraceae bacterium]